MKIQTIKDALWGIAKPYPRLQGLLMRQVGNGTQGGIWAKLIEAADLDAHYFSDVCYEYETAKKKLPDPLDDLIVDIIKEVKDRKYLDDQRFEQMEKYHRPKAGQVMSSVTSMGAAGAICLVLGKMVKEKEITQQQSHDMLEEALAFDRKEAERPDWLDDMLARSKAAHRVF